MCLFSGFHVVVISGEASAMHGLQLLQLLRKRVMIAKQLQKWKARINKAVARSAIADLYLYCSISKGIGYVEHEYMNIYSRPILDLGYQTDKKFSQ